MAYGPIRRRTPLGLGVLSMGPLSNKRLCSFVSRGNDNPENHATTNLGK